MHLLFSAPSSAAAAAALSTVGNTGVCGSDLLLCLGAVVDDPIECLRFLSSSGGSLCALRVLLLREVPLLVGVSSIVASLPRDDAGLVIDIVRLDRDLEDSGDCGDR